MKKSITAMVTFILLHCTTTFAQGTIDIQLNKLEDKEGSCRAYLVFKNHTPSLFREFKLDLVMFSVDDVIIRRLAVDSSPLRGNKTSVKLFDIEDLSCADIHSVLVNDVLSCRDEFERDDCVDMIEPSSKGSVSFIK